MTAQEAAHAMSLPTGGLHERLEAGTRRLFEQADDLGGLCIFAGSLNPTLTETSGGRFVGRDCRGGIQILNGAPDTCDGSFAVREFLDGLYARQLVPNPD